jgi:hypothetical protein
MDRSELDKWIENAAPKTPAAPPAPAQPQVVIQVKEPKKYKKRKEKRDGLAKFLTFGTTFSPFMFSQPIPF